MSETITLGPNEYLMREGEKSTEMYYLQTGNLAVYKRKGNVEIQIGTIGPGELVGEISFLDQKPRSATIKAMTSSELVVIHHEKLESTLGSLPKWLDALMRTLTDRLRKANSKMRT